MLSSVLRSETAIAVNIKIMRTFTKIRKSVHQDSSLLTRVELIEYNQSDMRKLLLETTNKVDSIFQSMQSTDKLPIQGIFFDGQNKVNFAEMELKTEIAIQESEHEQRTHSAHKPS